MHIQYIYIYISVVLTGYTPDPIGQGAMITLIFPAVLFLGKKTFLVLQRVGR